MNTETTMEAPGVLTEIKTLNVPDMDIMNKGASSALRMAQSFVIANEEDYQLAGEELQSVKLRIKKMEDTRTGITGPMNKALKAINDLFRGPMAILLDAERVIKSSMLTYYDEQERKAAEARRQAEAKAEAERQRIAREAAEVERLANLERQRVADEAAKAAAAAKAEQDRLDAQAAQAAAEGNQAAADEATRLAEVSRQQAELDAAQAQEQLQEQASLAHQAVETARAEVALISAPVTHIGSVKAAGISAKVAVDYEVTNLAALVKHIAENPALISLVMEDSVKMRAYVRGLGLNTNLPGVRVFQKRSMSARAA